MNFKERRLKAEQLMRGIDDLCSLEYAYSEIEEDELGENLRIITGARRPSLWEHATDNGRSVGYAAMFSKLLLAYLLSEIKKRNLLNHNFLEEIKGMEVEPYTEFLYYDCGYKISEILKRIMQSVIQQEGYFKIETFPIFLPEREEDDSEEEDEMGKDAEIQKLLESFISDCPELKRQISADDLTFLAFRKDTNEYEVEIEKISSEELYQIKEREKSFPSKEGKEILEESSLFEEILHKDLMTVRISYRTDLNKRTGFYAASPSSIFGDGSRWNSIVVDRHHRYCYSDIFKIDSLIKKIKEYKKRYLES